MRGLCVADGQKFLLIGDSITDCGRRDHAAPFGAGYVAILRDMVTAGWPERNITWVNKGIGGNKIYDLQERWEDDVIREVPDWLSIKIGINDVHTYLGDPQHGVSPARFREGYLDILTRTKEKLQANLVLITPFYISTDRSGQSWRSQVLDLLPEYIGIVEEMAQQFGAKLVRLQPLFERQLKHRPAEEFCPEPVHPNRTGHVMMAMEVLRTLCE